MLHSFRSALHLSFCLIRIPHLALSLFVFPLLIGLAVVWVQLVITGVVLKQGDPTAKVLTPDGEVVGRQDFNLMRYVLFGAPGKRAPLMVCRWVVDAAGAEVPPGIECAPDRLDVALQVTDPATFDPTVYGELFEGEIDRLHLCTSCHPDLVIRIDSQGEVLTESRSLFGLGVVSLPFFKNQNKINQDVSSTLGRFGEMRLFMPDVRDGIAISRLEASLPFVMNVSVLVLSALWLSVRAHRKVLDYFTRNDVLLPMVAACGKGRFYAALWILTLARVGCFLGASVPLVFFGLQEVAGKDVFRSFEVPAHEQLIWIASLVSSFALAAIIASIAELKHRHTFFSIAYKIMPLLVALVGTALWGLSLLSESGAAGVARMTFAAIPVVGVAPLMFGPILKLPIVVLCSHLLAATLLMVVLLRRNARWFAAHLEEV
jgi:hypothetical protein